MKSSFVLPLLIASLALPDNSMDQGVAQAMKVQTGGLGGAFVWPSLIRKLDRLDESYKT